MRVTTALMIGALGLAGCGGPGSPSASGSSPEPTKAMPHPDAAYLMTYGGEPFRVNVRYVPLIEESVIAVRQGTGESASQDWRRIEVPAQEGFSRDMNFADDAYEAHVLGIASAVQAEGGICPDGGSITMSTNRDGEIRTLFWRDSQAWVVFALCPEQAG